VGKGTGGQTDRWAKGQVGKRTGGQRDRWAKGQVGKGTGGQRDRWAKGQVGKGTCISTCRSNTFLHAEVACNMVLDYAPDKQGAVCSKVNLLIISSLGAGLALQGLRVPQPLHIRLVVISVYFFDPQVPATITAQHVQKQERKQNASIGECPQPA
jgi:hypothetical protein